MRSAGAEDERHVKGTFEAEVQAGDRFEFGKNWARFVQRLDERRIVAAEDSLKNTLGVCDLKGRSFLDVGSGSGLFSLAAMRLGADRVFSFDYDPQSVACTTSVRKRFLPDASAWKVERGDILDSEYVDSLGRFDIVYSWGVLHHTGNMNLALEHVTRLMNNGGLLFIAIYNNAGWQTYIWRRVKAFYNSSDVARFMTLAMGIPLLVAVGLVRDMCRLRNPLRRYVVRERGMSFIWDRIDWLGGYPFEYATTSEIVKFYSALGLQPLLVRQSESPNGCNEYVFKKLHEPSRSAD